MSGGVMRCGRRNAWRVVVGDCVEQLRELDAESVDAVVTDPPYGIGFMGKEWDVPGRSFVERRAATRNTFDHVGGNHNPANGADAARTALSENRKAQVWHERWAREALRVLKPGGHLLAFGGTRTYHRLACAIEDAGFEVRDCLMWLYGSGFPKSLNVGNGWGTALKPAWEPVVVARKPLAGTVAGNVLEHGTGAVNIDGCRVGTTKATSASPSQSDSELVYGSYGVGEGRLGSGFDRSTGRWPANVVLSHSEDCVLVGERPVRADGHFPAARGASGYGSAVEGSNGGGLKGQDGLEERSFDGELVEVWACVSGCPVRMLDDQTGVLRSGDGTIKHRDGNTGAAYGAESRPAGTPMIAYGDAGGASRFFYCAKASRAERNAGLREGLPRTRRARKRYQQDAADRWWPRASNRHPTVKPIDLMRWLVRLVTPPGGTVLDPFAGSGTTGCAAVLEGFEFVGAERDAEYARVAEARIRFWREHPTGPLAELALRRDVERRRVREAGQLGFDV